MNLAACECGASDFQKLWPPELAVMTDEVNNDNGASECIVNIRDKDYFPVLDWWKLFCPKVQWAVCCHHFRCSCCGCLCCRQLSVSIPARPEVSSFNRQDMVLAASQNAWKWCWIQIQTFFLENHISKHQIFITFYSFLFHFLCSNHRSACVLLTSLFP